MKALSTCAVLLLASTAFADLDVTPNRWYIQTDPVVGVTVSKRTERSVHFTYGASYHGIIGQLDEPVSLDAPGDYIQFEYEMNGPDAGTFFAQEDYWVGVGLFNDQGDPVTNDQGTESDGSIGFFAAIGWEFGSKSSIYEQRAGDAQILSRSVRDNGISPATGDGVVQTGGVVTENLSGTHLGRVRFEVISDTQATVTFTAEQQFDSDIAGDAIQDTVLISNLPNFNQAALDFGSPGVGSIEIDMLSVTTNVPEPASAFMFAGGAFLITMRRRARDRLVYRRSQSGPPGVTYSNASVCTISFSSASPSSDA